MANPYPAGSAQAAAYENAKYRGTQPFVGSAPVTRQISIDFVGETPVVQDPDNPNRYVPAGEQNPIDRTPVYQARLQELWNVQQRQQQQQTQQQQQQIRQQEYAEQSQFLATRRAGYYQQSQLGDRTTQERIAAGEDVGTVLEEQRQAALLTPTLEDDRFFANELQKWNHNAVEESSAYHNMGMELGVPINANMYENVGDIALAFEKGGNPKDFGKNYGFNPNVGMMISLLPNGKGLQETAWDSAKTGQPSRVDFMPAIDFLNSQRGRQGVYGNLAGGIPDKNQPREVIVRTAPELPRPFISPYTETKTEKPSGLFAFFLPEVTTKKTTYAPQEQATVAARMAGTDTFSYKLARDVEGLGAAPWVASKGEIPVGVPIYGEKRLVGEPRITEVFDPTTGITTTISEQQVEQDVSQKYEQYDISKQVVIPTRTETTSGKSGYDVFQQNLSNRAYSGIGSALGQSGEQVRRNVNLFGEIQAAKTNAVPTPTNIAESFAFGMVKDTLDKPVEGAVWAGIAVATYGLSGGAGVIGTRTIPYVTRIPVVGKTVVQAGQAAWGAAPYVLGGLYTVDASNRVTQGYTDFRPGQLSQRTGGVFATEIVPMYAGWKVAAVTTTAARNSNLAYNEALGKGATTGRFDYYVRQPAIGAYNRIPSIDQMRYKWIEMRTPSTAMNQPMPYERFTAQKNIGTGRMSGFRESTRSAERRGGTPIRSTRGTGSGISTPSQESLKYNFNPTAPLTELPSEPGIGRNLKSGGLSGIRGNLRGKWDTVSTGIDESMRHLPLKERWKAREGLHAESGSKGYYGGGKPVGGLQSGVGAGGTTVRSGRQSTEIRMPSSGISMEAESLAPQRLEISPSRKTAQRSRAMDDEFEYVRRKLPDSLQRPSSNQAQKISQVQGLRPEVKITPRIAVLPGSSIDRMVSQNLQQKSRQVQSERQVQKQNTIQTVRTKQEQKNMVVPISILRTQQVPRQKQDMLQTPALAQIPKHTTKQTGVQTQTQTQRQRKITENIIKTERVRTPKEPVPFGLPSLPGIGSYHPVSPYGAYQYREHAPTITPKEMATSLFTGSFTKRQPRRQSQANVNTISLFGKSKRRFF